MRSERTLCFLLGYEPWLILAIPEKGSGRTSPHPHRYSLAVLRGGVAVSAISTCFIAMRSDDCNGLVRHVAICIAPRMPITAT